MRETLSSSMPNNASFRITPAYAGNTTVCRRQRLRMQDHPRVCGKHWKMRSFNLTAKGSPPRMRETLPVDSQKAALRQDHPRVCGKHGIQSLRNLTSSGSPPRMRETPIKNGVAKWGFRITPAYAGNTKAKGEDPDWGEDHPRVCGKHTQQVYLDLI